MSVRKHLTLLSASTRLEVMDRMEDAVGFIFLAFAILLRIGISVVFFHALYGQVQEIGGWTLGQAYVLLGTWHFVDGVSWATYTRGFMRLKNLIERGSFDLMLITPVHLRTYLCYRFIDVIFSVPNVLAAIMLVVYGASTSDQSLHLVAYGIFLAMAFVVNYSFTVILGSINFFHIIEAPHYLRNSIMRLGQYPISIYKGVAKLVLSFVIPVAFMFTFPAQALFGNVVSNDYVLAVGVAVVFYLFSSWFWNFGLKHYKSAQG